MDRLAYDLRNLDDGLRGDLAGTDDEAGLDHGFDRDSGFRVLVEVGVQQGIADLVADFVGMTFGHRLGSEQVSAHVGVAS